MLHPTAVSSIVLGDRRPLPGSFWQSGVGKATIDAITASDLMRGNEYLSRHRDCRQWNGLNAACFARQLARGPAPRTSAARKSFGRTIRRW